VAGNSRFHRAATPVWRGPIGLSQASCQSGIGGILLFFLKKNLETNFTRVLA
jgi:hypothetical protein